MQHILINGISAGHLSVMDRGLHYGDGLFETIACIDGKLQFWAEHLERMRSGAEQLKMDAAAIDNFQSDISSLLEKHKVTHCVIKLILTRGQSVRGYRSSSPQRPTRIVLLGDLPQYPEEYATQGIKACFCQHPVSSNSQLAGIKHLNRLDNVLARNEWGNEYQEGIMLNDSGNVIEGTMSNIFAVKNKQLYTPSLSDSGVDGIIRGQILSMAQQQDIETHIVEINKEELKNMEEIFVCNSIIGIWPVTSLNEKTFNRGALTKVLSHTLQQRMHMQ